MAKVISFFISYMLVPLLILLYAQTGAEVYKYSLGTLCVMFFALMVLVVTFMNITGVHIDQNALQALRNTLERKLLSRILHFVLGLCIAMAIFVYVNTWIAIVYCGSLLLLQVLVEKVRKAAFA